MDEIRVLVALHEPLLREGVARMLESTDDLRPVALAGGVRALEDAFGPGGPDLDVAVVDVRYQRDHRDLLERLHAARPEVGVLVFVDHEEGECLLRSAVSGVSSWVLSDGAIARADECCLLALRHHALGCIPRSADRSRVVDAVRAVAQGRVAAQEWALARWMRERSPGHDDGPARITAREVEVIRLVADGLSNKAIARALGIQEQTVKNYVARIMRKLGVSNRVEVALVAREHNLAG